MDYDHCRITGFVRALDESQHGRVRRSLIGKYD
jgi:hypothetical protein